MTIDNLVDEVRQLIVTRDRGAIAGLAERASASEWADATLEMPRVRFLSMMNVWSI